MVAGDLREIERQVVGQQAMLRASFFQRDVVMCFRKFLKIVQVVNHRVVIVLGQSGLEEMQDDLGIFRIILIPGVVHGFSSARQSQRRNELRLKSLGVEEVGKRPMVVARGFETDRTGKARPCRKSAKERNSSAVFCTRNFFRLFHPGASIKASWRSLATSIATHTTASGVLC